MNKSQIIAKKSIRFWKRLREIQASQPSEENVCSGFKEFQNFYYTKYIKDSIIEEEKNKNLDLIRCKDLIE
jgi:hypothetical protein